MVCGLCLCTMFARRYDGEHDDVIVRRGARVEVV